MYFLGHIACSSSALKMIKMFIMLEFSILLEHRFPRTCSSFAPKRIKMFYSTRLIFVLKTLRWPFFAPKKKIFIWLPNNRLNPKAWFVRVGTPMIDPLYLLQFIR